jgi:hypothetical protein
VTFFFSSLKPGWFFLDQVNQYTYASEGSFHQMSDAIRIDVFKFKPDGYNDHAIELYTPGEPTEVTFKQYEGGDVSAHWERIPEFGDWAGLTNRDRFAR